MTTRDLVRAALPHPVEVEGRPYVIRPPTVAEAFTLAACDADRARAESATAGAVGAQVVASVVAEATATWRETLAAWLPDDLADFLSDDDGDVPYAFRRGIVAALLFDGAPPLRPGVRQHLGHTMPGYKPPDDVDALGELARMDAADAIGRVGATFGVYPETLLARSFPMFLLSLREAERQRAQRDLTELLVASIPHMEDGDRTNALDRLHAYAGANDADAALTWEERVERGRQRMAEFRRLSGFPTADDTPTPDP